MGPVGVGFRVRVSFGRSSARPGRAHGESSWEEKEEVIEEHEAHIIIVRVLISYKSVLV